DDPEGQGDDQRGDGGGEHEAEGEGNARLQGLGHQRVGDARVTEITRRAGAQALPVRREQRSVDVQRCPPPGSPNGRVVLAARRPTTAQTPRMWMHLIYGTMIVQTEDETGAPGLATKWTAVDPQTVELTLRDGVKFSDGTPFNADAVKTAWDRLITGNRA